MLEDLRGIRRIHRSLIDLYGYKLLNKRGRKRVPGGNVCRSPARAPTFLYRVHRVPRALLPVLHLSLSSYNEEGDYHISFQISKSSFEFRPFERKIEEAKWCAEEQGAANPCDGPLIICLTF